MKRHIQRMKTIKLMKIMLLIGIMTWVIRKSLQEAG